MIINKFVINNISIAVVSSNEVIIKDVKSALDLLAKARHVYDCNNIVINEDAILHSFFDITSKQAGEILNKVINYKFRIAIIGQFKACTKRMKEFMCQSNKGSSVFFLKNAPEALDKLTYTDKQERSLG